MGEESDVNTNFLCIHLARFEQRKQNATSHTGELPQLFERERERNVCDLCEEISAGSVPNLSQSFFAAAAPRPREERKDKKQEIEQMGWAILRRRRRRQTGRANPYYKALNATLCQTGCLYGTHQ